MRQTWFLVAVLCAVALAPLASAQRTDATVSGTVTDPSGANVVGATVTGRNLDTGQTIPTTTNGAGVYTMPSLLPGKYSFTAEHAGFRKGIVNDVILQVGTVMTLNLPLELGQITESVEVEASSVAVNATSSSVGNVVETRRMLDLPLAGGSQGRSAYDLILTQPGVQSSGANYVLNGNQGASTIYTMDGISAMDNLHSGTFYLYSNIVSVDRAEEFRVVTSPADAEYGRGAGQVQMATRGGSNKFSGSAYWEVRNGVFNANTFFNNALGKDTSGHELAKRDALKENNYGVRFGGPIKKNKTFFNGIWEPFKERINGPTTSTVYTAPALNGLFRFYPGVVNGNFGVLTPTIDSQGNPVQPATATGPLQTVSVLGRDPNRLVVDPTGFMTHTLSYMTLPNSFRTGDGLNTAGYTFNRPTPVNFELYEGRVDHVFNEKHRVTMTADHQSFHSYNVASPKPYPTVPGNSDPTETTQYSVALSSIFRPNLLNDARVGVFRYRTTVQAPSDPNQPSLEGAIDSPEARTNMLNSLGGQRFVLVPSGVTGIGGGGIPGDYLDPTYQWGDAITWIKGRHSFKGGFETRWISLAGYDFGGSTLPSVTIGASVLTPVVNISSGAGAIPGIGQNGSTAETLLYNLTGTISGTSGASQLNISPGGKNPIFLPGQTPFHEFHQNEWDWYFKDDFKVKAGLTLNLGVRWEMYQHPTEGQGKMLAPVGGGAGVFGISGTTFAGLFNPNATGGTPTQIQAIGAGTANPGVPLYNTDKNNFAPALGLSWAVPGEGFWKLLSGGKNKMTFRMGYGISYQRQAIGLVNTAAGGEPGYSETDRNLTYTALTNLKLPVLPAGVPLALVPQTGVGSHTVPMYGFDLGLRTPYTQNFNVSIQRGLKGGMVLNLSYVGSKSTKLIRNVNTNEVNIFENGILDAFNIVRAGGTSPLIDKIFSSALYPAVASAGGGSNYVRTNSSFTSFFANNNPGGFASTVSSTNALTGVLGGLLPAAGLSNNFIVANPQFTSTNLIGNFGNSTYHSLQAEVSKRFSHGLTAQGSYVWSHNLGDYEGDSPSLGASFRTLRNESLDKRPLGFDYQSVFKANGIYELPFGRGKLLGRNANSFVDRFIGGWQIGAVTLIYSGRPLTFTAQNTINTASAAANFTAVLNGAVPAGSVTRTTTNVLYFTGLTQITDPSVASISSSNLRALSGLKAIADASGTPLIVNPLPGQMGPLGQSIFRGPGAKNINLNLIKRAKITERVTFQLGVTAQNATNTPIFGDPTVAISSTSFGRITGASGNRLIVIQSRFNF